MDRKRQEPEFDLSGGALCLDFANTLADRPRGTRDSLGTYRDLLAFGGQTRALEGRTLRKIEAAARRDPGGGCAAFRRAVALRERLYRIFGAVARGRAPEPADLAALNAVLSRALGRLRIASTGDGFRWIWPDGDGAGLDQVLWPIARSAGELLTSPEREQVRECSAEHCSWLFIDRSPTRRRRWCDMKTCGNRAKARRFYQRNRVQAERAESKGVEAKGVPARRLEARGVQSKGVPAKRESRRRTAG